MYVCVCTHGEWGKREGEEEKDAYKCYILKFKQTLKIAQKPKKIV